jgi:hypothetical protein
MMLRQSLRAIVNSQGRSATGRSCDSSARYAAEKVACTASSASWRDPSTYAQNDSSSPQWRL